MAKAKSWVCIEPKKFSKSMDELRNLMNWLIILEREYGFTKSDANKTRAQLQKVVKHIEAGLK